jgi:hypothetical protein
LTELLAELLSTEAESFQRDRAFIEEEWIERRLPTSRDKYMLSFSSMSDE